MTRNIDLSHLSPAECILLAEQLWDRAASQPDDIPVPPQHRDELRRRLAAIETGAMGPGEIWDAVRDRLWNR
jgi:putative addiction module component (TIGR02574 family)